MLWSCEHAYEPAKDQVKTSLRFRRWKFRNRWLFANDMLQFGDKIDDQQAVRLQRLPQCFTPLAQLVLALAEERPDQALKRLRQRRIRNVSLVLVELSGCKQAAGRDKRLMKLVH